MWVEIVVGMRVCTSVEETVVCMRVCTSVGETVVCMKVCASVGGNSCMYESMYKCGWK